MFFLFFSFSGLTLLSWLIMIEKNGKINKLNEACYIFRVYTEKVLLFSFSFHQDYLCVCVCVWLECCGVDLIKVEREREREIICYFFFIHSLKINFKCKFFVGYFWNYETYYIHPHTLYTPTPTILDKHINKTETKEYHSVIIIIIQPEKTTTTKSKLYSIFLGHLYYYCI